MVPSTLAFTGTENEVTGRGENEEDPWTGSNKTCTPEVGGGLESWDPRQQPVRDWLYELVDIRGRTENSRASSSISS